MGKRTIKRMCYICGAHGMSIFYKLEDVPVHSVLLLSTRKEALDYPKGNIALGFCPKCGFISNLAFDSSMHEYSTRYEGTQAFSHTFESFHQDLAKHLIERYDLHRKHIIEIGCGQGEFLTLLCKLGGNRGTGFDPAYREGKNKDQKKIPITFIKDFYSEKYAHYRGDFICCKMTLEHIPRPVNFVKNIRRSIGDQKETIVFFQVPDVKRILDEVAFWDIYYEHCSYFSLGSLARLFRKCEFDVLDLWKGYDDQYLMIEAKPHTGKSRSSLILEKDLTELTKSVAYFTQHSPEKLNEWHQRLTDFKHSGKSTVIWGAGSKGVAFLTTLKVKEEIDYAVDINPHKHGTYMPGTGHSIVEPHFLKENKPDVVIIMNPVYYSEIHRKLLRMGISAELIPVGRL